MDDAAKTVREIADKFGEMQEQQKRFQTEFDKYKANGDPLALAKADALNDSVTEIDSQIKALQTAIEAEKSRADELEARMSAGYKPGDEREEKRQEHLSLFEKFFRTGGDPQSDEAMALRKFERKAVSTATGAAGGFAVPEIIGERISEFQKLYSPIRSIARVQVVGTSDYKELLDIGGEASGWAGDGDARTETATPSLRERAPTHGTLYCYPKASEESLEDIFFDVGNWLANKCGKEMAVQEGSAFITGDGTKKPTGFLNTAAVATDDDGSPTRGAEELQFVASGSAAALTADGLIDLVYKLNSMHRANGVFVMNSATTAEVRKLKDSQNQYLWQMGIAAGQPSTLLGYPVVTAEGMPDVAANALPVAFGDWQDGYLITDRASDLRISVDDNTTSPGFVKWYIRKRVGGILLNNNAIKVAKCFV